MIFKSYRVIEDMTLPHAVYRRGTVVKLEPHVAAAGIEAGALVEITANTERAENVRTSDTDAPSGRTRRAKSRKSAAKSDG